MADLRQVIVTPGRVAYTSPKALKKLSDTVPQTVVWNDYFEELLNVHGDIQIVNPKAAAVAVKDEHVNFAAARAAANAIDAAEKA